jgi:ubiquinone/menaquinone biosynthesis C-methylase UbiE
MNLEQLQASWHALGENDPYWAILSVPELKGGGWAIDKFYQTGVENIAETMRELDTLKPGLARGRALDFGCGAGRLTQALAAHFDEAVGVDIAPSMIRLAEAHNRRGAKCQFHLNSTDDLQRYPDASFDFVFTFLVLQHMRPEYSTRYIGEFLRVLKPGGVAMFQVPSELTEGPQPILAPLDSRPADQPIAPAIEMYGVPKAEVLAIVARSHATLLAAREEQSAGKEWLSFMYCVGK